ncbi:MULTISPECIES: DUF3558 domain-containing protein [unclassified Crossiella]|uniref:DUF3558 domain-containing protein n=1 Tax=unclassified Crossiella TaxID=2620835 RepID=UPI001FFE8D99|nr:MULTISPECIES: DUF3558 domain-containing protein [unclassified Crossiella]MCK2245244.1 DUF3558 domain-containing protein [Crossiella sp. S99.2]MCK2258897.1 DUF3558 domain-containing protein [Crossiella sp. S99.1]
MHPWHWSKHLRHAAMMAVVATALITSACTGSSPPTPHPAAKSEATTTSSRTNKYGAPPLTQPELNTAPFADNRCALLSPAQLAHLGITVTGQSEPDTPLGLACRWIATDTPARIDFSLDINTQLGGLDQLYGRKNIFKQWEPVEISGYPAVNAADIPLPGQCRTNVAVSNTVLVAVTLQLKSGADQAADYHDPCPRGARILDQVLITLKGDR